MLFRSRTCVGLTAFSATSVFSLTIFMIAAIMSMVIVNAALNNAQRIQRQREERQAMLAVSSAMPVAESMFEGCVANWDKDNGKWKVSLSSCRLHEMLGSEGSTAQPSASGAEWTALEESVASMLKKPRPVTETWKISPQMTAAAAAGMDANQAQETMTVDVIVTLNADYSLEVTVAKEKETDPSEEESAQKEYAATKTVIVPAMALPNASVPTTIQW